jgi:hypothetical protein
VEIVIAGIAVVLVIYPFIYPRWRKWEIAREKKRNPRKVSAGGLVAPFDEVFHPTAYTANLLWEAEKSIPAPTPDADGNWPDLESGRITISVPAAEKGDEPQVPGRGSLTVTPHQLDTPGMARK